MSTAEIKLELFRKIDNLSDTELNKVYAALLSILTGSEKYTLNNSERKAIDESLEFSKNSKAYSHESVINEAQKKYSHLRFNETNNLE